MNEEMSITPYRDRKVYRVGDGQTAFSTGRPLTGEEKVQPSLAELLGDLGNNVTNLALAMTQAFEPVFKAINDLAESPEWQAAIRELERFENVDPKAAARQRSRGDLAKKRRELRMKRGR